MSVTRPYTNAKDMITRSVSKYCIVVDEDVNSTHVEDVATATEGSMPISKKNGEKISPPPTPTRPASKPVAKAITWYSTTFCADHLETLYTKLPQYTAITKQDQSGKLFALCNNKLAVAVSCIQRPSLPPNIACMRGCPQEPGSPWPSCSARQACMWKRSTPLSTTITMSTDASATSIFRNGPRSGALALSSNCNGACAAKLSRPRCAGADPEAVVVAPCRGGPRKSWLLLANGTASESVAANADVSSQYWFHAVRTTMKVMKQSKPVSTTTMVEAFAVWL
mmetsp:Transcript_2196/g.6262  ORF Transcript_2196/g.6262 Transcript_2196/m.6262 type:complete len:281 (-) Transcript_2196:592-1434(-)